MRIKMLLKIFLAAVFCTGGFLNSTTENKLIFHRRLVDQQRLCNYLAIFVDV